MPRPPGPMKRSTRRFVMIALCLGLMASGTALLLYQFTHHIVFFYTPSMLTDEARMSRRPFRVGGLVTAGSVVYGPGKRVESFMITDGSHSVRVEYGRPAPLLFREGQGVVATGTWNSDHLLATDVLAKHDENYRPPAMP